MANPSRRTSSTGLVVVLWASLTLAACGPSPALSSSGSDSPSAKSATATPTVSGPSPLLAAAWSLDPRDREVVRERVTNPNYGPTASVHLARVEDWYDSEVAPEACGDLRFRRELLSRATDAASNDPIADLGNLKNAETSLWAWVVTRSFGSTGAAESFVDEVVGLEGECASGWEISSDSGFLWKTGSMIVEQVETTADEMWLVWETGQERFDDGVRDDGIQPVGLIVLIREGQLIVTLNSSFPERDHPGAVLLIDIGRDYAEQLAS